jgi:uncharacterized protein
MDKPQAKNSSSLLSSLFHFSFKDNTMNNSISTNKPHVLSSFVLGLSLIIASSIVGLAFYKSRQLPRYVTVKGLAERDVTANVGIWPISFTIANNDLDSLQNKLEDQQSKIIKFITSLGFSQEEISYGIPNIDDNEARQYGESKKLRYTANQIITLCSSNVLALEQALQSSDQLLAKGIMLSKRWDTKPKFIFTKLNEIKPIMIQEATIGARKAAEQFAQDSGSKVGKIYEATQGLFSIEDTHLPTQKHVRVVTKVKYFLADK